MTDSSESPDETVGEFVDRVKAAPQGELRAYGYVVKYLGEIQLESPPDGEFHTPFPDAGRAGAWWSGVDRG